MTGLYIKTLVDRDPGYAVRVKFTYGDSVVVYDLSDRKPYICDRSGERVPREVYIEMNRKAYGIWAQARQKREQHPTFV